MRSHQELDLIEQFAGELAAWDTGRAFAERTLGMLRMLMGVERAWVLAPDASSYAATRPGATPKSLPDLWARHLPALAAGRCVSALVPEIESAVLTLMPIRSEDVHPRTLGLLLVEDPSPEAGSSQRLAGLRRFSKVLASVLSPTDIGEPDPEPGGRQRKTSNPP